MQLAQDIYSRIYNKKVGVGGKGIKGNALGEAF